MRKEGLWSVSVSPPLPPPHPTWALVWYRLLVWDSLPACSVSVASHRGSLCPRAFTAMPAVMSTYLEVWNVASQT